MNSLRHRAEADTTCDICGKSGLKGVKGLNIHKRRSKACKQVSLTHNSQQQELQLQQALQSQQERQHVMAIDIRLPAVQVWIRPQSGISDDNQSTQLHGTDPNVHQLFQEIASAQQQQQQWRHGTEALNAENDIWNRFLLWVYFLPISRYFVPLCLFVRELVGNTLHKIKHLAIQLAAFLYLLAHFVYYCLALIAIVAALYVVAYTLITP
ncbi:hypothetical protein MBANPS3_004390 [Mucor bainieri]